MKPFHFSLELVRTLRQQKERAAQLRYTSALSACDEAERLLQFANAELAAVWGLVREELVRGLSASQLANLRMWCQVLETRRNERQTALHSARRAAETALQAMTVAAREREALDRFHDKSRLAHHRATQREEQKNIDEMAVQLSSTPGPLQSAA
jgi:flagellar export protein FliJ